MSAEPISHEQAAILRVVQFGRCSPELDLVRRSDLHPFIVVVENFLGGISIQLTSSGKEALADYEERWMLSIEDVVKQLVARVRRLEKAMESVLSGKSP